MQKNTIINAIEQVLNEELNLPNMNEFHPKAKLNEDLYLDSVLLMQLLISLELNLGIDIPDSTFTEEDFATVNSLADFLLLQTGSDNTTLGIAQTGTQDNTSSDEATQTEEFEDIKVHCFVSCLCEIIKADPRVDHRPFYFGVWDADVVVDVDFSINYHSDSINHDFFKAWYQKLYGVTITPWYQEQLSKKENIGTLLDLLDNKKAEQSIMVMLDMFLLPERENKFNQNPFPHYVMLENTDDPDTLFMTDPDFRWEGEQNKAQVLTAISSKAVSGGYYFNSQEIQESSNKVISDYFIACFNKKSNPMTDAVRSIINHHLEKGSITRLASALTQLPVLAIRKYAYEHGLAFFLSQLDIFDEKFDEFETWCDVIEVLVSTYKKIQFRAMKLSNTTMDSIEFTSLKKEIFSLLDEQDQREFSIKNQVQLLHSQWSEEFVWDKAINSKTCLEEVL